MRRWVPITVGLGVAGAAAVVIGACQSPTQIILRVTTDFDCSALAQNKVTVRIGGDTSSGAVQTESVACKDREVGRLVITPSPNGNRVAIEVMAALTPAALDNDGRCVEGAPGCLHARRALNYIRHDTIDVQIVLESSCVAYTCDPSQTCFHGACVNKDCSDGRTCSVGDAGAPADSGPPPPPPPADGGYAALCGDTMGALQAGAPYAMAWGCGGGAGISAERGPASPPQNMTLVLASGDPYDVVVDKDNVAYLTNGNGKIDAIDLNTRTLRWTKDFQTTIGIGSAVVVADGTLLVGLDNFVAGMLPNDAGLLQQATTQKISSDIGVTPTTRLVFANGTGLEAIDTKPNLKPGPNVTLPNTSGSRPFYAQGWLWIGASDGSLRKLDPMTLLEKGRVSLADAGSYVLVQGAAGPDKRLRAFWMRSDGVSSVGAIDPNSMTLVWSKPAATNTSVDSDLVAVGPDGVTWVRDGNKTLHTFDASGTPLGAIPSDSPYPTLDVDGNIYVGDATNNGSLSSYDAKGTLRWKTTGFAGLREVIVAKNGVIVASGNGDNMLHVYW